MCSKTTVWLVTFDFTATCVPVSSEHDSVSSITWDRRCAANILRVSMFLSYNAFNKAVTSQGIHFEFESKLNHSRDWRTDINFYKNMNVNKCNVFFAVVYNACYFTCYLYLHRMREWKMEILWIPNVLEKWRLIVIEIFSFRRKLCFFIFSQFWNFHQYIISTFFVLA